MIVRVGYNRRQAHVHKHSDPLLVCSDASCQQLQPRGRGARRVCDVCDNRPAVLVHEELECLNLCHHARSHCVCTNLTVITAIQRTSRSHNSVNILSGYIRSWSRAVWRARAAASHPALRRAGLPVRRPCTPRSSPRTAPGTATPAADAPDARQVHRRGARRNRPGPHAQVRR